MIQPIESSKVLEKLKEVIKIDDNVINIEVTYDDHGDGELTTNVHESFLIK